MKGIGRVVRASGNILTAAVLSSVYAYAHLQTGMKRTNGRTTDHLPRRPSIRYWLASTALARRELGFRMRDGSHVRSRILDGGGLLSVYVDRDYDVPGLDWSAIRTIVDVGAHVGSFTIWAARRSPRATVLAVEPNPETFSLLMHNIRGNGLQDRVRAVNAAVAPEPGIGSLEFVEHSLGTRLTLPPHAGALLVTVCTLPGLLADAELAKVDLLKIDCEGMEYAVLEAMGPRQLESITTLACEYHPEPGHNIRELDHLLELAGFAIRRPDSPLGVLWATR